MVLKSRNEPLEIAGARFLGAVASQIILESPRSIGNMVIASRNRAKNASANIRSIPSEMRIASRMTGITAPAKKCNIHLMSKYTSMIIKLKAMITSRDRMTCSMKKNGAFYFRFGVLFKS